MLYYSMWCLPFLAEPESSQSNQDFLYGNHISLRAKQNQGDVGSPTAQVSSYCCINLEVFF